MKFFVVDSNAKLPRRSTAPFVELRKDNWDDFGYKTNLSATLHLESETLDLGTLKILEVEQSSGYTPLPKSPFENLDERFCSLSSDMEYYEKLLKCGFNIYDKYLSSLRDVVYDEEIRAKFEDLEGYKVSLLRFSGAERFISEAERLFKKRAIPKKRSESQQGFKLTFKTSVAETANPFAIRFDFQDSGMSNRLQVVIGYNGTGKTRLLSNLAIAAWNFGYEDKDAMLNKAAGRFIGPVPRFETVIVVSYSAFDTFAIPGSTDSAKGKIRKTGGLFGYVYCGLRELDGVGKSQSQKNFRLRTPDEIEQEFLSAINRIRESARLDALVVVLEPLLKDASFQRIGLTQLYSESSDRDITTMFRELSSGHKIVLKIIIDLAANMDESKKSLVLIDEPETHLHPPLLATLLKSIRLCLEYFDGYAVIATHSPVVLQETPPQTYHILRPAWKTLSKRPYLPL